MLRLAELQQLNDDWAGVVRTVRRLRAVNPLLPAVNRLAAEAAGMTGDDETAIAAWTARLAIGTEDLAEAHFRLAELLHRRGDASARREVLLALEIAPRYRAAQELLLKIVSEVAEPASAIAPENLPKQVSRHQGVTD